MVRAPEINPSKRAAKRLGISESEFEESVTREINELLQEIEDSCHAAFQDIGKESSDRIANSGEPFEPGDTAIRQDPMGATGRVTPGDLGGPSAEKHDKDTTPQAPIQPRRRRKEKCYFGPGAKRG
jgi:hypothetical protein